MSLSDPNWQQVAIPNRAAARTGQSNEENPDQKHPDDVISRRKERQPQQVYCHDQHTAALPSLVPGQ